MAWLPGWSFRKAITLSRSSGAVTNYQMRLLIGESSGAGTNDVLTTGCKSDFSDLRFTKADGTTLLDYWIEEVSGTTPNQVAAVWIEFDSIGTTDTTFYLYFGNSVATDASSGANTFIKFDDFERGNNADAIGGAWTAYGNCDISTTYAYGGTRAGKLVAQTPQSYCTLPVTASADTAIRFRAYKLDASSVDFIHGDGSSYCYPKWENDEKIWYYNGSAWVDSGASASKDAWHLFELYGFNFTTDKFSMSLDGAEIINAGAQRTTGGISNIFAVEERTNGVGNDVWFDNVIVRNWRAVEPAWGSWGDVETVPALSGWTNRKKFTLSRSSGAVTNYPLKIKVGESSGSSGYDVHCAGHCKSDFSDLRLTKSDGTTLLDYYIEDVSGTTPNQVATIWVEFDSIGTGATTFYMYYGNASASVASNGPNTFSFFEDFNGLTDGALNGQHGWSGSTLFTVDGTTVYEGAKAVTVAGATIGQVNQTLSLVHTWNTFIQLRMRASNASNANVLEFYLFEGSNQVSGVTIQTGNLQALIYPPGWVPLQGVSSNTWYKVRLAFDAKGTHKIWINDTLMTPANSTNMNTISSTINRLQLEQYVSGSAAYADQIMIGQYLATEPAFGSWGSEEFVGSVGGSGARSFGFVMIF